jgi:ubiquinone/menaquinone biosynthesis C-methylase UbiE
MPGVRETGSFGRFPSCQAEPVSDSPPDWLSDYPSGARDALEAALSGSLDPPIALTRLFLVLGDIDAIAALLERVEADARAVPDGEGARRIDALRELLSRDPGAFDKMRDVLAILHGQSPQQPSQPGSIAKAFDAAAELSPAASVALYSLGDATLLGDATQELVSLLRLRGLVSRKSRVLEIGCGIGRFAEALAPEVQSFRGIDISKSMIRIARQRCGNLANVAFSVTSGHDLHEHVDESFDLVLAVDSFPYIVATQSGLAELHIKESARVLTPGGDLVIFNFAYEEVFGISRERLRRFAHSAGLALLAADPTPLRSWDGSFFHLRKQSSLTQFGLV